MTPERLRAEFALDAELVFLNHGSYGACPRPVLAAQRAWQEAMERNPVEFLGRRSAALLREARSVLAAALGAEVDDLAWVANTTVGVNLIAQSLAVALLQPGDEVLASELEYGACLAAWRRACTARGATLRTVPAAMPFEPEAFATSLIAGVTSRTRVLFASHITSATALVLPVAKLVQAAHERGLVSVIDGAHAPGQIGLDLQALGADFYVGNLHKWLCAPKGSAFVHARREWHRHIDAAVVSWGQIADAESGPGEPSPHDAYSGARPLERRLLWQGTRDPSAWLAVPAALDFLRQHVQAGEPARAQSLVLATQAAVLARNGLKPIASAEGVPRMLAIPVRCDNAAALQRWLFEHRRIEVPVTQHAGQPLVRLSVAPYTTEADCETLIRALSEAGV